MIARGGQAHVLCICSDDADFDPPSGSVGLTVAGPKHEWDCLARLISDQQANVLVIDHYRAIPDYQRQLEAFGLPWLQFDYRHAFDIRARWIVNISPTADVRDYASLCAESSRFLLGSRFAILRSEFKAPVPRPVEDIRSVLVMLGGGDDRGIAALLVDWLSREKGVHVSLVTTRVNPRLDQIQEQVRGNPALSLLIEPESIARLMRMSDVAICAGGTTTFELVSQAVPFLSVALADNQVNLCRAWEALGVSLHLGGIGELNELRFREQWARIASRDQRTNMQQKARNMCDNGGAERIVKEIETWL